MILCSALLLHDWYCMNEQAYRCCWCILWWVYIMYSINDVYTLFGYSVWHNAISGCLGVFVFIIEKSVSEPGCVRPDGPKPITSKRQTECVVLMFASCSPPSLMLSLREFISQSNYLRYWKGFLLDEYLSQERCTNIKMVLQLPTSSSIYFLSQWAKK